MNTKINKIRDLIEVNIDKDKVETLADKLVDYFNSAAKSNPKTSKEGFVEITNLFLFEHGLVENIGMKDYVLVDFLKNNSFLVRDIKLPEYIFESSILDIELDRDLNLINTEVNRFFDLTKEFVALNSISKSNQDLCRAVVDRMPPETIDRKFLRVLSYYTAVYCLHLRVDIEKEEDDAKKTLLNLKLDHMFDVYEDFTSFNPNWYIN